MIKYPKHRFTNKERWNNAIVEGKKICIVSADRQID